MTFITQDRIAPAFRITADDTDITAGILARFKWLRLNDESGLQSDLLEIGLADHDPTHPLKIPRTGAELRVWLGYDGKPTADKGLFVVDEIELQGPPDEMVIRARAAVYDQTKLGKTDLQTQKVRDWPNGTKLGAMVTKIAKEHGMQAVVAASLASITLPHLAQTEESDLSFLVRVLRNYDTLVKPQAGKLIVAKRGDAKGASGNAMPAVYVDRSQTSHHSMTKARREKPGTVVAYWHATKTAKRVEVTVGEGDPVTRIRHFFPTQAAAQAAAQAALDKRVRGEHKLRFSMVGDPALTAERPLTVTGFRDGINGDWLIRRVEHHIDGGGYRCDVEAELPNGAPED
ncbi:phage tail protein [Ralstonia solanacearum]|nr:phage tail protein [Ralstonia solanacearum]